MYTYSNTYIHAHTYTYKHVSTRTHAHTHTRTHTHTHTHHVQNSGRDRPAKTRQETSIPKAALHHNPHAAPACENYLLH